jgi:hypothetical protein
MTQFRDDDKNLTITAEECAEVILVFAEMIQTISKIKRFGYDDCSPYTPDKSNRKKLTEELGHVTAMVYILIERNLINEVELFEEKNKKLLKLKDWY